MAATMSRDGKRRLNLPMKLRLDAMLIAFLVVSRVDPEEDSSPSDYAQSIIAMGKRKILELCRVEIEINGTELCSYRVGDNNLESYAETLADMLKPLFGID